MHIDAVKEFYAKLILVHYKKKDVARSKMTRENGVWWLGSGENRRRDDEVVTPAETVNEEEQKQEFDWEVIVDKVADQGESGSDDKFYDAQVDVEEPVVEAPAVPAFPASPGDSSNQQKEVAGVDPSGPSGHLPDSVMSKLQADFERARANRIQADLEKAQAENARLLALLQQAQSQPKPLDFTPFTLDFLLTTLSIFCLVITTSCSSPETLLFFIFSTSNISITHFLYPLPHYD
ncbi:hypothetical protein Dimus_001455 [Dionaea muscipula]